MAIVCKNYVLSLCQQQHQNYHQHHSSTRYHTFSRDMYEKLLHHRDSIESQIVNANLVFQDESCNVLVQGQDEAVKRTSNLLCHLFKNQQSNEKLEEVVAGCGGEEQNNMHHTVEASNSLGGTSWNQLLDFGGNGNCDSGHVPITRTVSDSYTAAFTASMVALAPLSVKLVDNRRKLESEDSSYDSDQEYHAYSLSKSHDDVSRTFSETLALESSEYISRNAEEDLSSITSDPSYNSKVEFALRLGYSESLLQKALLRLGINAGQNKILEELIRLQNSRPPEKIDNNECRSVSTSLTTSSSGSSTITVTDSTEGSLKTGGSSVDDDPLMPIVIDGSNVAMSHGNKEVFSCKGIKICVKWFQDRGHKNITVFVPRWRKESSKPETQISDQHILTELEKDRFLSFTPSRQVSGRRVVCHDDRYILNLAAEIGAIVVTNDNYRELISEKPEYKKVINERILMYSFVNDRFMPPDDPLGRSGPTLDVFLRKKPKLPDPLPLPCPYGKKCTYGNKCKYFHAERGNQPQKSITDKLKESSSQRISEVRARVNSRDSSPADSLTRTMSVNLPPRTNDKLCGKKQQLCRTKSTVPKLTLTKTDQQQQQQQQQHSWQQPPIQQQLTIQQYHNKSRSFENISAGKVFTMAPPPVEDTERPSLWSNQLNLTMPPYTDTSMPPPPPRGPWTSTAASTSIFGNQQHQRQHQQNDENKTHLKLSRQLSLNPSFDARIHCIDFPFPPPTDVPPPFHHQNVTRIASAPERTQQQQPPQHGINQPSHQLRSNRIAYVSPTAAAALAAAAVQHQQQQQLHKSISDSWQLNKSECWTPPTPTTTTAAAAVAATSSELRLPLNNLGPIGSRINNPSSSSSSRSDLYYHLKAIFPEEQVLQAMAAMPDDTDGQKLCEYIINQK